MAWEREFEDGRKEVGGLHPVPVYYRDLQREFTHLLSEMDDNVIYLQVLLPFISLFHDVLYFLKPAAGTASTFT